MIACPEEIAFLKGFIDRDQLRDLARGLGASDYGRYLATIADRTD
jgi:glucose-1-phosphate thymidylyltransferase